jgi:hypothetical protein
MTPNERLELRLAYEVACTNYLSAFMKQYDLSCDPEPWVGNEIGTIAEVGDYFFSFYDIKRCVDENVKWEDLIEWYDYNIEVGILGLTTINLKSWLMGAPRVNQMRIEEIKAKRKELEELIEETKKENGGY